MAEFQANKVAAVVLAGGASSRMGRSKAQALFLGEPLVLRVIERLRPQVGEVYLNVREDGEDWGRFGAPLLPDPVAWRGAGPLAGVAAALTRARADGFTHLVTAPCDAPFAPLDLAARLWSAGEGRPAVAVSAFGLEPMFALWPVEGLGEVDAALRAGRASPRSTLAALNAAPSSFPAGDGCDPFANLNTPGEFDAAERDARRFC